MTRCWDSRSKEPLFLALVLFYKSRPTFIYNRTATSRQVCCSAGDRDLHNWRSRCCATFATAQLSQQLHNAWDEFWPRRRARKRDSAERTAIFFFLASPGKPMRAPDEKQRSDKVHPCSRRAPSAALRLLTVACAWIASPHGIKLSLRTCRSNSVSFHFTQTFPEKSLSSPIMPCSTAFFNVRNRTFPMSDCM